LNTTSKRLYIGNHEFLDWDDLDDTGIEKVLNYIGSKDPATIHKYIDKGFSRNFKLMVNGKRTRICNILPGDDLEDQKVLAVVRINGDIKKRKILYHLITEKGYFVKKKHYMDYNSLIDKLFYMN
jgi:hypothetical protein